MSSSSNRQVTRRCFTDSCAEQYFHLVRPRTSSMSPAALSSYGLLVHLTKLSAPKEQLRRIVDP